VRRTESSPSGLVSRRARSRIGSACGRLEGDRRLRLAGLHEGFDGGKGGGSGTANEPVALIMALEVGDEFVAGIAPIQQQDAAAGMCGNRVLTSSRSLACAIGWTVRATGQAAKDVVSSGHQALGIMAFAGVIQPAVGSKAKRTASEPGGGIWSRRWRHRKALPRVLLPRRPEPHRRGAPHRGAGVRRRSRRAWPALW